VASFESGGAALGLVFQRACGEHSRTQRFFCFDLEDDLIVSFLQGAISEYPEQAGHNGRPLPG